MGGKVLWRAGDFFCTTPTSGDQAMRICIEGPDTLSDADLVEIITHWKEQKPRRIFV